MKTTELVETARLRASQLRAAKGLEADRAIMVAAGIDLAEVATILDKLGEAAERWSARPSLFAGETLVIDVETEDESPRPRIYVETTRQTAPDGRDFGTIRVLLHKSDFSPISATDWSETYELSAHFAKIVPAERRS